MTARALEARALWIVEPGRAELRSEMLPEPSGDQVLVQTRFSALSRGTESLVFRGGVPAELHGSMRCPHQAGELSLPVKYGYCSVGRVVANHQLGFARARCSLRPQRSPQRLVSRQLGLKRELAPAEMRNACVEPDRVVPLLAIFGDA